ncbi:MAG TPA: hypothetical protein VL961_04885 [Acidimicrobiales bacterium]|nr:hypothetical protein [Acidimicrobiales bacterium]
MKVPRRRPPVRITQGRLYSAAIVVLAAALLLPSLAKWKPAASLRPLTGVTFPHRPAPSPPDAAGSTTTSTTVLPAVGGSVPPLAAGLIGVPPAGLTGPAPEPAPSTLGAPLPGAPPTSATAPAEPTCKAAPLDARTTTLLNELNASLKILPTNTMETVLGLVTGCNDANPALLAVGALSEVGDDLTILFNEIPGASSLKLPSVHAVRVPADVLPLLAALEPVFAPLCGEVNSASDIVILIAPHYPQVIDGAASVALFQAAATCGELTGAG